MDPKKILRAILSGSRNIRFSDMVALVEAFGFKQKRIAGSHYIFVHPQINQLVNLQEVDGEAKPYQIRQFLKLVEKHHLKLEEH